ncbi:MAG: epoxyqueuosine reductase QueH [Candidatus Tectomicrobia bacterium]|uniref:Epoxyqueuosine reductase QueH n=1 Tax=Tectimicrobiota bacterium TaxID=2528274 RepID=A0A932CPA7_UNCTE|nr:epoxyqueuosine reductase QueH [Candidatus Tectomicrobia bacterium]
MGEWQPVVQTAKSVLLHVCCANCLLVPWRQLQEDGVAVRGYFDNPNIHPYQEYQRRRECLQGLARQISLDLLWTQEYAMEDFLRQVAFREKERCRHCYRMRLEATVRRAHSEGVEVFSTTLLYSKYQAHALIREIGEALAIEYRIPFLYRDWRVGWAEGVRRSRELGLYRQKYCGCIYSEKERYARRPAAV